LQSANFLYLHNKIKRMDANGNLRFADRTLLKFFLICVFIRIQIISRYSVT